MKKYLYIIAIISFFVFSHNVFATSGACSSHGGVNCSIVGVNGSAICNDGFKSSVSYYTMQECTNTSTDIVAEDVCSASFPASEFTKYTQNTSSVFNSFRQIMQTHEQGYIDQEKSAIDKINATVDANIQEINATWNPLIQKFTNDKNNAIASATANYATNNPMGSGSDGQQYISSIGSKYDSSIQTAIQSRDNAITQQRTTRDSLIASYNNCANSLTTLLAKMKSYSLELDSCTNAMGANSTPTDNGSGTFNSCSCVDGYVVSKTNGQCVIQSTITPTQITDTTSIVSNPSLINNFTRTLKYLSKGNDVKLLQQDLIKLGYLPVKQQLSNNFGSATKNAVIKFQKDNNIKPASGVFDYATQKIFIIKLKVLNPQ